MVRERHDGKKDPRLIQASSPLWAADLWADIHDSTPVWLAPGQFDDWLRVGSNEATAILLASEPPAMAAYRVSRAVNTPRNNSEEPLQSVA
jgi:putative SOS response-associated peptidase YedK